MNHAYAMLVSSQFQGFCRNLHTEAVDVLVSAAQPAALGSVLQAVMIPNPAHLGADFSRLGMLFWVQVNVLDARNPARQKQLEQLNVWRNAIAHRDWTKVGGPGLRLSTVTVWRSSCAALAKFMFGGHEVQATVIEDRGPVGAKGRRILRIRLDLAAADPMEFEVLGRRLFPETWEATGERRTATLNARSGIQGAGSGNWPRTARPKTRHRYQVAFLRWRSIHGLLDRRQSSP